MASKLRNDDTHEEVKLVQVQIEQMSQMSESACAIQMKFRTQARFLTSQRKALFSYLVAIKCMQSRRPFQTCENFIEIYVFDLKARQPLILLLLCQGPMVVIDTIRTDGRTNGRRAGGRAGERTDGRASG